MKPGTPGYFQRQLVKRTQSARNISSQDKTKQIAQQFGEKYAEIVSRPQTQQIGSRQSQRRNSKQSFTSFTSQKQQTGAMPPLNVKTLKYLNNNDAIEVIPNEVIFKDIELNQTYEMVIFVQNLSKVPKRIKIIQPQTQKFRVDYDAQGAIAAGLTMKLVVTFETSSLIEDYSDNIQIIYETQVEQGGFNSKKISQKNIINLPIFAFRPQPELRFESYINLGFVRMLKKKVYPLKIQNFGSTTASIKLDAGIGSSHITFNPQTFTLQSQSEITVELIFCSKDTSVYRYSVEVQVEGQPIAQKIDVNATSVDFNKFIVDEDGTKQEQFDFGDIYYGQKKQMGGFLTNNTPRKMKFKVIMRKGILSPSEDNGKFQTPQEQGLEITEQIMKCSPLQGIIQPYSQHPLQFTCQSKVTPKNLAIAKNFALTDKEKLKEEDDKEEDKMVYYTCIVDYEGEDNEQTALLLHARRIHPLIKFDKPVLNFGDCDVNDHRDIMFHIENRHPALPIDISIPRVPQFKVSPKQIRLEPFMKAPFIASFVPNNVGRHNKNMDITFINSSYSIPLKIIGTTSNVGNKRPKTRGPECLPQDFEVNKKYIDDENKKIYRRQNFFEDSQSSENIQNFNKHEKVFQDADNIELHKEMVDERIKIKNNNEKYIKHIREQKDSRILKQKQKILQMRVEDMEKKLQEEGGTLIKNKDDSEIQDPRETCPADLEWEVKMNDVKIDQPVLELPNAQEPLFVLKPIGMYEPIKEEAFKHFNPDPNSQVKKHFEQRPVTHKDTRDIHLELDGESLQKIFAGPKEINFGEIFVKSRVVKTFVVKNDLRNAIKVQLHTNCVELIDTYQKPQIIPSSETGKFEVVLCSQGLDDEFKQNIKYTINGRHEFEFEVKAKIAQVKLEMNKQQMKFQFADDNNYMETSEVLTLKNNGNASGVFAFDTDSKIFFVEPKSGEVPSKGSQDIRITYRPSLVTVDASQGQKQNQGAGGYRTEQDKLIIRVQDGQDMTVKCIGTVNEPKCVLKQTEINLDEILVSKEEIKFFQLRNTSRIPAVFRVMQEILPDHCSVTPVQGRIPADGVQDLTLKYCNNDAREINDDIPIMIRGGKIIKLPFSVTTVVPQIMIKEAEFDFGKITLLGNSGALTMTLMNNSNIDADLTLDMRGEDEHTDPAMVPDGIECLTITPVDEGDESILKSVQFDDNEDEQQGLNDPGDFLDGEDLGDQEDSDSEENVQDKHTQKLYNFIIKANSTLKFELKFNPKDDKPYLFDIPIALQRYGNKLEGLKRQVKCVGIKPKFLVEPQIVDFGKKVITSSAEKMFALTTEITLSNPGKSSINWRIPDYVFKNEKVFQVYPQEGRVDGGCFNIKASFNPLQQGSYEKTVPFYIDDPDIPSDQPYLEITLKGEAAYPRLVFDRREILMPVTPLGIESKCVFKILNEGYENLSLNYRILDELDKLNIELNFPEGKTMGIAKSKIRCEAVFKSNVPLSFTTRINFLDEQGNSYQIPISGTTDNSLFTNFGYIQRSRGEFTIKPDDKGSIQIIDEDHEDLGGEASDTASQATRGGGKGRYAASVGSGKTLSSRSSQKAGLGYTPIPKEFMDNSRETIKQWLNANVLTQNIQSFPENVVEEYGDQLFQLLTFLCGSQKIINGFQAQINKHMKRSEKCQLLFEQYDNLIRYLKTEGALLNHIRPQYLLSYNDCQAYLKSLPKETSQYTHSSALKMPGLRYQYIHNDSWITIFYQILKLYYLSRISSKIFKQVPGATGSDKQLLPDCYTSGSNLYCPQEGILLRWLELNNEISSQRESIKLTNFESDLVNGFILSGLIKNYLSPLSDQLKNLFQTLKPRTQNDDEHLYNCTIVHQSLKEIGMSVPFTPIDLVKQSARENLLLLIQLYNSLPNYIPKGQPIIFQCVLGESVTKTIELTNPTHKPISYWVKYDGTPDFIPEFEDCFKIEPKQIAKFKVTFKSRVSQPVTGRLTFTNKKETNLQAAALVFELKSQINGRISIKNHSVDAPLYESKEFSISVQNNFENAEFGEFSILIVHEKELQKPKVISEKEKKKNAQQQKKKKKTDEDTVTFQETPFIPSFFCKIPSIRLKRKASYNINMNFVPMVYENQKCYVIFSDPNVGEFQHEIIGQVGPPEEIIELPKLPIQPPIFVDDQRQWPVQVPFINSNIRNARRIVESWTVDRKVQKKSDVKPLFDKQPFSFPKDLPDTLIFEVEADQPGNNAVIAPRVLTLVNPKAKKPQSPTNDTSKIKKDNSMLGNNLQGLGNKEQTEQDRSMISYSNNNQMDTISMMGTGDDQLNNLNLVFHFKNPMRDYRCNILLKNNNLTDVRRYRLTLTAYPKPIKAIMEMQAPAKELILQEIPILNNTDRDWHIKVNLTGNEDDNFHAFYVQNLPKEGEQLGKDLKDVLIRKKTTGKVPLIFYPEWILTAHAKLLLTNNLTNDVFEYELKGIGEEPLAEDNIVINCIAKQTTYYEIVINNPYKDKGVTYRVETDLMGASGSDTFTIQPKKKKGVYKLSITPVLSGEYTGSITFTEDDGTYIWYTVVLNTESPPSNQTLDLTANLRKAVALDIELSNPHMEAVTFEVLMDGEGLIGDQYFSILPVSTSQYELIFMPLKTGVQKGSIAFVSEKLGEIWYELNLVAEDSGTIRLPQLRCELGKVEQHEIVLENPSNKEQRIKIKNSNYQNFEVTPEEIVIQPFDCFYAHIKYLPSALDTTQQAEIVFESEDIGKWQYLCFGVGIPPTQYDPKLLTIGLNKDYSTVIHFKNPFKDAIQVKILLDLEDYEVGDVIKLLKKNQGKMNLQGLQTIQIPFTFTPTEIREYKANIIVQMNDKIQWVYPIIGITESLSQGLLKLFKTRCRSSIESEFEVSLPGISQIKRGKDDLFNFEIQNTVFKPHQFNKIFEIKCVKNHLESPTDVLKFKIKFAPLKPFKQTVDLIINRQIGGLWKFKLNLESTQPFEDDIIVISSPLHKTNSVSFRLTNRKKALTNFTAKFTPDSDAEFSVTPKTGILEPHGTDGSKFTISFTPVEYGKIRQAKLVIETEEMYWSYVIKGILPKYSPPQVESHLNQKYIKPNSANNKTRDNIDQEKQRKNFMALNINKTRLESNNLHEIKEQSFMQKNQSKMDRSAYSPSQNNQSKFLNNISVLSRNTVQSRQFTSQQAQRKKKF